MTQRLAGFVAALAAVVAWPGGAGAQAPMDPYGQVATEARAPALDLLDPYRQSMDDEPRVARPLDPYPSRGGARPLDPYSSRPDARRPLNPYDDHGNGDST